MIKVAMKVDIRRIKKCLLVKERINNFEEVDVLAFNNKRSSMVKDFKEK